MDCEIIDSGYAESKEILNQIKQEWKAKGCKVKRIRTDTKGLLMYIVIKE